MSPFFDGSKHKKDAATAMKVFGQLAVFNKDLKNCEELKEKELIEAKELFSYLVNEFIGGSHLELLSISRVINHMTCYKFECSHWLKLQHSDWRANLVKEFFSNTFSTNKST